MSFYLNLVCLSFNSVEYYKSTRKDRKDAAVGTQSYSELSSYLIVCANVQHDR